jgi:hypothetical protein
LISPVGTFENSPAIHCRETDPSVFLRPAGTIEKMLFLSELCRPSPNQGGLISPVGTSENSPAIHCRETDPSVFLLLEDMKEAGKAVCDPPYRNILSNLAFLKQLPGILNSLTAEREIRAVLESFKELLNGDWEFRFTFNYLFREAGYDNEYPFNELIEKTDEFMKTLQE